ncbi:hypothetical protein INT43_008335 [Umbelopsis isabellina]|uniref:Amidohydrolase-related domain-containing protein n=1 Tax=Mortierella isabellina TaxID=91625 RepID=A0A8H7U9M3_MORIS|nr:hypothetical protein INT43_008335 [Umbelopsis isabellina]
MLPLITLEEHYLSEAAASSAASAKLLIQHFPSVLKDRLTSLTDLRLQDMKDGNISLQIVSHNPAISYDADICRKANDEIYKGCQKYKSSFAGFAALPMADPVAAAEELTHCVNDLGFVGALITNHANGRFYDGEDYYPFWERAQALDVPIYLHPTNAWDDMMPIYRGDYSEQVAGILSTFGWGWHADTGLHFIKLFCSGTFDRFPKLKVVIGHNGEMVPCMLQRQSDFFEKLIPMKRTLVQVWNNNIWVTTSGMFTIPPFLTLMHTTKIDRIMYSVDYPYCSNTEGLKFMEELQKSGLLTEEQFRQVAYGNAEQLFKVKVQR